MRVCVRFDGNACVRERVRVERCGRRLGERLIGVDATRFLLGLLLMLLHGRFYELKCKRRDAKKRWSRPICIVIQG